MFQFLVTAPSGHYVSASEEVSIPPLGLPGTMRIPKNASGIVIFAHGSGSSRFSPRNAVVADALNEQGMATLLLDLLTPREESENGGAKVFDISLLASQLIEVIKWVDRASPMCGAPIGLFGANTGSAAALLAAAKLNGRIAAIVSRGGRPELAGAALAQITTPTMLITGGADFNLVELNDIAYTQLKGPKKLVIIPSATQLFHEPGTFEQVIVHASNWFERHLTATREQMPAQSRYC